VTAYFAHVLGRNLERGINTQPISVTWRISPQRMLSERTRSGKWERLLRLLINLTRAGLIQRELRHFSAGVPLEVKSQFVLALADNEVAHEAPIYPSDPALGPAGAIVSNLSDMTQYLLMYLNHEQPTSDEDKWACSFKPPKSQQSSQAAQSRGKRSLRLTGNGERKGISCSRCHLMVATGPAAHRTFLQPGENCAPPDSPSDP
jgi:hypothetical protein